MRRLLLSLLALSALAACKKPDQGSAPAANANGPIVIGEVGSMTGTEATFGLSSANGIQLAIDEFNAKGGVKGRQLQVKVLDDQGRPEEAAIASTRSMFMAPKAQQAKVPMVTPSSTNPAVTQKGDYIFRACFIDPFQGYVAATFATENLKVKKVAVLKDVRNDYSVGLAKNFIDSFVKTGGQIVAQESYSNGDVDFKAQLTNIKGAAPQALYVPGYYTDVGLIARQARETGITVPMLGGDGWDSEKLFEIGGDAIVGSYFSNHYSPDDPSPRIQEFVAKYKKTYGGQTPDSLAAQAYDAAGMLVDAMKRAKDLTGPSIRDALAATRNYPGVTGNITLDENRNPLKPAVVLKVGKGGKYEFVTKIYPEGMRPETGSGGDAAQGTKTGSNTAPAPAGGSTPTQTVAPAPGSTSSASSAANTGQPQGVPAAEHPKK